MAREYEPHTWEHGTYGLTEKQARVLPEVSPSHVATLALLQGQPHQMIAQTAKDCHLGELTALA